MPRRLAIPKQDKPQDRHEDHRLQPIVPLLHIQLIHKTAGRIIERTLKKCSLAVQLNLHMTNPSVTGPCQNVHKRAATLMTTRIPLPIHVFQRYDPAAWPQRVIQKTQQVLLTPFRSKKVFEKHVVQRVRSPHTGFDLAIRKGEILMRSLLVLPLLRHALHLAPGFSSAAVTG